MCGCRFIVVGMLKSFQHPCNGNLNPCLALCASLKPRQSKIFGFTRSFFDLLWLSYAYTSTEPSAGSHPHCCSKSKKEPQGLLTFGAGNGNLNPCLALCASLKPRQSKIFGFTRSFFDLLWLSYAYTSTEPSAGSHPHCCSKSKKEPQGLLTFGAGNGNRTRIAGLGSRSFAIRLYLHIQHIYFISKSAICQPLKFFF